MAWTSGFFNSVNGDRTYNASQMSAIFEGLITDGVYASVGNKLAVQPNSGMTIKIGSGRGWFNKHWVNNDSDYLISLEQSDVTLNRYAAIIIRVNEGTTVRDAKPTVVYSNFATNPVKPTMSNSETVKDYCLAYVYIKAGASAITKADIEDTRGNNKLCGWVTGLIEQLSTTTLFDQWTAIFNNWFIGLQDLINENTEAMLVNSMPQSVMVTLKAADWEAIGNSGIYGQVVEVLSMNPTKIVIVQPVDSTATYYSAAEVKCLGQGNNSLEFQSVSKPLNDIAVNVIYMGA